jgi:hypothetical protein
VAASVAREARLERCVSQPGALPNGTGEVPVLGPGDGDRDTIVWALRGQPDVHRDGDGHVPALPGGHLPSSPTTVGVG